jgi:hypothetical protein
MRAYVHLSASYLRLAIDLCEHDSAIVHAKGLAPADFTIRMYYEERAGLHRGYVSALALFTRVGREGDVADELDALCRWRDFKRSEVEQRFNELRDSPGFVDARGFTQGAGLVQGVRGWQFHAMGYLKHTVTHGDHTTLVRLLRAFADRQLVKAPLLYKF